MGLKQVWDWIVKVGHIGTNVNKILENQNVIISHLEEIKTPKEKLEELKLLVDLTERKYKTEIDLIKQKGTQQNEDKQKIEKLNKERDALLKYKVEVDKSLNEADNIINAKDKQIADLQKQIKDQAPPLRFWESISTEGTNPLDTYFEYLDKETDAFKNNWWRNLLRLSVKDNRKDKEKDKGS